MLVSLHGLEKFNTDEDRKRRTDLVSDRQIVMALRFSFLVLCNGGSIFINVSFGIKLITGRFA